MRYFKQTDWEAYQAARRIPEGNRSIVAVINFEAGRKTLRAMGIDILPIAPPTDLMISRRPQIKNFTGTIIRPEDSIATYELGPLMGYPLDDIKNLLNSIFGEGKNG